jgi:Ca-activated chloride channel family protein
VIIFLMTVSGSEGGDIPKKSEGEQPGKPFSVKVNVDLVPVNVTVWGEDVPELQAKDFILYDNKIPQEINYFSRNQIPIAIALLVDTSYGIIEITSKMEDATISALQKLDPKDQVILYSFSQYYQRKSDLTTDRLKIAKEISKLRSDYGTDIYGTLYDAARYLKNKAPDSRRAIVLISDNCHLYSIISSEKVRKELLETATTLYSIVVTISDLRISVFMDSDTKIKELAEETGGEAWEVGENQSSLKLAMGEVIDKFHMQYILGFNPTDPGKHGSLHELDVRFSDDESCPGCKIKARKGYYAGIHDLSIPQNKKP